MNTWIYDAGDIQQIVRQFGLNQLTDNTIDALTTVCNDFDPRVSFVPARHGFEYSEPHVGLIGAGAQANDKAIIRAVNDS